jgi:alcohol dehydrogenase
MSHASRPVETPASPPQPSAATSPTNHVTSPGDAPSPTGRGPVLSGAAAGARRQRPHGWVRHNAGFLTPNAAAALPVLFERDGAQRVRRAGATLGDRAVQRVRARRPRMRALQVAPGTRLRWREVPAPAAPGPDGATVHPIAASTCDIDCPLALGATQFALPLHLGHECVAEVLAVGERVRTVKPGDTVVVPFQINCGTCRACRAGRTGSCTSVVPAAAYGMGLATGHYGGAFSDELTVPYADAMLLALPDGIEPAAAASVADNVCDAYRHIAPHLPALLEEDPEAEVLILAAMNTKVKFAASNPLYTALIAQTLGARNVHLVDARPRVRAYAEGLGIDTLQPRELRRRAPAPLVVDLTIDKLGFALSQTAPDGTCSSAGSLHRSASVPTLQMYVRNVTLHVGRTHARATMPQVLELMRDGGLHPERVTSTVAPLDEAPSVLREHFLGGGIKTVLTA